MAAAKIINAWIEQNTHGMIKNMLGPSSFIDGTRLVLANAVYFKGHLHILLKIIFPSGTWMSKFDKDKTLVNAPFYTLDGGVAKADQMCLLDRISYAAFNDLNAAAVRLPFE